MISLTGHRITIFSGKADLPTLLIYLIVSVYVEDISLALLRMGRNQGQDFSVCSSFIAWVGPSSLLQTQADLQR